MSGRARGQARGRARSVPTQAARKPGEGDQKPTPPSTTPQGPTQQQTSAPAAGRARTRGTHAHAGARPGSEVSIPVKELSELSVSSSKQTTVSSLSSGDTGSSHKRRDRVGRQLIVQTRPEDVTTKLGTGGDQVNLVTNYIQVRMQGQYVYQYRVDFTPIVENKRAMFALIHQQDENIPKTRLFDGTILYLATQLPDKETKLNGKRLDDSLVVITIKLIQELPPDNPQVLHIMNTLMNKAHRKMNLQRVGRNYFDTETIIEVKKHDCEIWTGVETAINMFDGMPTQTGEPRPCPLLMLDLSFKVNRTQSAYDLMDKLYRINKNTFRDSVEKELLGTVVMTKYNNKTYSIDDISWDLTPGDTFEYKGTKISYMEYYKKEYDKEVSPNQPLLVSRPKRKDRNAGRDFPINLVPELCTLTGISESMKNDFAVRKDLDAYTKMSPDKRESQLVQFLRRINETAGVQEEFSGWKFEINSSLVRLNARCIPQENIFTFNPDNPQHVKNFKYEREAADWGSGLRSMPMIRSVRLDNWVFIYSSRNESEAQNFINNIMRAGPPMGMHIGSPIKMSLNQDTTQNYLSALRGQIDTSKGLQLVCCMVNGNKKDRYDAIKKLCCCEKPVPSQVILSKNHRDQKKGLSVATKVAVQLNCKLSGEIWTCSIPTKLAPAMCVPLFAAIVFLRAGDVHRRVVGSLWSYRTFDYCSQIKNKLMVAGYDSYHDSSQRGKSVGALVTSLNGICSRWTSRCSFQHTSQELMDGLKTNFVAALKTYMQVNGTLPGRIMFYRDGVGDGQLALVFDHELPQILSALRQVGGEGYEPNFMFCIVKKRVNARFFEHRGSQIKNPTPGTVIDQYVTRPEWFDFYLVSQSVRQGTVSPTHFNVIYDKSGLQPDHIQRFTYKLCHMYYNWPGTIRVPAPCQYAHKMAFLVGQSLHVAPAAALQDSLFYL